MIWIVLFCVVISVIFILRGIADNRKCNEEWEQVVSWSEYKKAREAYSNLIVKPLYNVGTYARFKNVTPENLCNYVNIDSVNSILSNRKVAKVAAQEVLPLLQQMVSDAQYEPTRRKLNELITLLTMACNSELSVIICYRTPKKAELRQRIFTVEENHWKLCVDTAKKKNEHVERTFAQEQRARVTKKVRFAVLKRDNFTCQYCGAHGEGVVLEVDHIVPISKGGTSDMDNLITACFDCNRGKGADDIDFDVEN